jgi:hypothetical protein
VDKVAKAIVAACTTLAAGVGSAVASGNGVSATQWVVIAAGAAVAGFGVWATTNAKAPTQ